jgi:hypothetical protein
VVGRNDVFVTYVELALDWTFADELQRDRARQIFDSCSFKKNHRRKDVGFCKTTRYTDARPAKTNLVAYSDKLSKATGEIHCLHVEWRLRHTAALHRAGIYEIADLLGFDHREFWLPRLQMRTLDLKRFGRRLHPGPPKVMRYELGNGGIITCVTFSTM